MDWTDERMDDLASRMDAGFDRTDHAIREVRTEIRNTRTELRTDVRDTRDELKSDIAELRSELKGDSGSLRDEMRRFRALLTRVFIALVVGLLGILAAVVGVVATVALGA
jgi:hypothetical protein